MSINSHISKFALDAVESNCDSWALETFKKLGKVEREVVEDIVLCTCIIQQHGLEAAEQMMSEETIDLFLAIPKEYGPKQTVEEIIKRLYDGQDRYGILGETEDTKNRNFRRERFEEVADAIVYDRLDEYYARQKERRFLTEMGNVIAAALVPRG